MPDQAPTPVVSKDGGNKDVQIPFEKLGLHVGDLLSLETVDPPGRYGVRLIGYLPGNSILVTPPAVNGRPVILKADKPVTVRAAIGGKVCAFTTQVRQMSMKPYPYIHLEYPKQLFAMQIRSTERIRVELPAVVDAVSQPATGNWPRAAMINDISKNGTGLKTTDAIGEPGDEVMLSFVLAVADVKRQLKLKGTIRNKRPLDDSEAPYRYTYGLQFAPLSDAATVIISGYLYEQFSSQ